MSALDPRLALLLPLLAWDSWRRRGGRVGDGGSAVPLAPISAGLICYALAAVAAPPLAGAGVAAVASMALLRAVAGNRLPWAPQGGLVLLALPVLPSFDFYLAYPMRLLGAALAACLLRLNGISVGVEGVALRWGETLLLFDAACSGIRMLWASLFLVSVVALFAGFTLRRYAAALAIAVAMAILGNAVRAASLFYLENGFVAPFSGPVAHEAVGLAAFLLFAALTLWLVAPRRMLRA
jgi:exosortase